MISDEELSINLKTVFDRVAKKCFECDGKKIDTMEGFHWSMTIKHGKAFLDDGSGYRGLIATDNKEGYVRNDFDGMTREQVKTFHGEDGVIIYDIWKRKMFDTFKKLANDKDYPTKG